jgi:hypothetical protein
MHIPPEPEVIFTAALRSCLAAHSREELMDYERWPAHPARNVRMQTVALAACLACEQYDKAHQDSPLGQLYLSRMRSDEFKWSATNIAKGVAGRHVDIELMGVPGGANNDWWYRFPISDYSDPAQLRGYGPQELELIGMIRQAYDKLLDESDSIPAKIRAWDEPELVPG